MQRIFRHELLYDDGPTDGLWVRVRVLGNTSFLPPVKEDDDDYSVDVLINFPLSEMSAQTRHQDKVLSSTHRRKNSRLIRR